MPETPWYLVLPYDFFDKSQDQYEADGWMRTIKKDWGYNPVTNRFEGAAVGSLDPLSKLATVSVYRNENLNLTAAMIDIFDQGVAHAVWKKEDDSTPSSGQGNEKRRDVDY